MIGFFPVSANHSFEQFGRSVSESVFVGSSESSSGEHEGAATKQTMLDPEAEALRLHLMSSFL